MSCDYYNVNDNTYIVKLNAFVLLTFDMSEPKYKLQIINYICFGIISKKCLIDITV